MKKSDKVVSELVWYIGCCVLLRCKFLLKRKFLNKCLFRIEDWWICYELMKKKSVNVKVDIF